MSAKRKLRRRQCGHKMRHAGKLSAILHLKALRRKDDEVMTVYRCRWCGCWHVGHKGGG